METVEKPYRSVKKCAESDAGTGYEIGLSMYSLRQMFHSYGGKLDALDYPRFAKETFGISLIDVWIGGFSEEQRADPEFYTALRKRAEEMGSTIFLLMAEIVDAQSAELARRMDHPSLRLMPVSRAS